MFEVFAEISQCRTTVLLPDLILQHVSQSCAVASLVRIKGCKIQQLSTTYMKGNALKEGLSLDDQECMIRINHTFMRGH